MKTCSFCGLIMIVLVTTLTAGCVESGKLQSITVTPAVGIIGPGGNQQFRATAHFSNGTNLDWTAACNWTVVSVPSTTIGNSPGTHGLITSNAVGTYEVQATDTAINLSGRAVLYVTEKMQIIPESPFMELGKEHLFSAAALVTQGTSTLSFDLSSGVTWTVIDQSVATVESNTGRVTSSATGTTRTTGLVALYSTLSYTATLTVTPSFLQSVTIDQTDPVISRSTTTRLTATGNYAGGSEVFTSSVIWSSSDGNVATIDSMTGEVTSKMTGSTTITAKDPVSGKSGSTTLVVVQP